MNLYIRSNNFIELRTIDEETRNLILILPGGGYQRTSPREGIPVCLTYEKEGYHTAIYHYRETLLKHPFLAEEGKAFLVQLKQMKCINQIFILGFSAGGHFACHLAELYPDMIDGTILAYPVITSDPRFAHHDSVRRLMGEPLTPEKLDTFSLEKHVSRQMKPIFIWHTMDDVVVPVENTLFLLSALRDKGIQVECHLYPKGQHGLSLATQETSFEDMDPILFEQSNKDVASWVSLSKTFLKGLEND